MNKIKYILKVSFVVLSLLINETLELKASETFFTSENATDILAERLDRMDGAFDYSLTPEVQRLIKLYLGKQKTGSQTILGKTKVYFPMIERFLEEKQLPQDLKYLPIIESSLKPYAKSHVGAAGLWQFMRKTGRMMGLKITSIVDERNDPIKSTEAALEYLAMLYQQFDDWTLAIAAYNCGPGNVRKAIRRAGSRDFWKIRPFLPKETRRYVPKFMATSYVINYYLDHGLTPLYDDVVENPTTAKIFEKISFRTIAKKLDMDMKTIKKLNPAYLKGYIPSSQEGYHLTLPKQKFLDLSSELKSFYSIVYQPMNTIEYIEEEELLAEEEMIPFTRELLEIDYIPGISNQICTYPNPVDYPDDNEVVMTEEEIINRNKKKFSTRTIPKDAYHRMYLQIEMPSINQ